MSLRYLIDENMHPFYKKQLLLKKPDVVVYAVGDPGLRLKGRLTLKFFIGAREVAGITGNYFLKKKLIRSSKASYDKSLAQQMWNVSAHLTGLATPTAQNV